MLESKFQSKLIDELEFLFKGCIILKNDANYIQGFPDLLILYNNTWAALECKQNSKSSYQPNQEYYLGVLDKMSYASAIWPEIKEEVINELQHTFRTSRSTCIP
jgi:hypothetical protein